MACVTLATITGNTAVLAALFRLRRAPAHYPLASLAAADLLVGLCVLPLAAARELFVFQLHWIICACWSTLDVLCCTASILSLCLLGWERWRGISAPLSRAARAERARLYAALLWPAAAAVALPAAIVPDHAHRPGAPVACSVNTNVGYVFVSAFFSFYLPACVMLAMYVRILRALATPPTMLIRAHRGRSPNQKPVSTKEIPKTPNPSTFKGKIKKMTVFLSPNGRHLLFPGTEAKPAEAKSSEAKTVKNSENPFLSPNGRHLLFPGTEAKPAEAKSSEAKTVKNSENPFLSPNGRHLLFPGTEAKPAEAKSSEAKTVKNSENPLCLHSRQQRATRTIVMLMALFLVCWTPFFVMLPLDSVCECVKDIIWRWFSWLGYANSALNPLVYAAASPSVRRALHASFSFSSSRTTSSNSDIPLKNIRRT